MNDYRKVCRCCGRAHSLADATAKSVHVGIQRYDYIALFMWNCSCGSTLATELPNPLIRSVTPAPMELVLQ